MEQEANYGRSRSDFFQPGGHGREAVHTLEAALTSGDPQVVRALLDAGARTKASFGDSVRGPYAQEMRGLLEQAVSPKAAKTAQAGKKK